MGSSPVSGPAHGRPRGRISCKSPYRTGESKAKSNGCFMVMQQITSTFTMHLAESPDLRSESLTG